VNGDERIERSRVLVVDRRKAMRLLEQAVDVSLAERYAVARRAVGHCLMPSHLRSAYDPEDFVHDALVELLEKRGHCEIDARLLAVIARRRMLDAARSPQNQPMLSLGIEIDQIDGAFRVESVDDRCACPVLQAEANELRERFLELARDDRERTMIELWCEGNFVPEIAAKTGIGLRTVQRFFETFAPKRRLRAPDRRLRVRMRTGD
jgi:DNA-directed RNA polymerase specialized sigma24 family protein